MFELWANKDQVRLSSTAVAATEIGRSGQNDQHKQYNNYVGILRMVNIYLFFLCDHVYFCVKPL